MSTWFYLLCIVYASNTYNKLVFDRYCSYNYSIVYYIHSFHLIQYSASLSWNIKTMNKNVFCAFPHKLIEVQKIVNIVLVLYTLYSFSTFTTVMKLNYFYFYLFQSTAHTVSLHILKLNFLLGKGVIRYRGFG